MGKAAETQQRSKKETSGIVPLDFIFGLPPDAHFPGTNQILRSSMPIARIHPGVPSFKKGIDLFERINSWENDPLAYHTMLKKHGFSIPGKDYVEVAYLADSFPTDSFTNEYGENFLQKFTDVASEGAQSLTQIAGGRDLSSALGNIISAFGGDKLLEMGSGAMAKAKKALGPKATGAINMLDRMMAGQRIDFPMVWKTSGFQPSYTMTVRLYNPDPGSRATTRKYIIGPIAAIMLLGIPISEDGSSYSWPYIHKIVSPGIYDLEPGFISNITVIKGGDQQQIAWNQQLAIVDVRIDFGSLYSSMMAAPNVINKDRPTLKKYIAGMDSEKEVSDRQGFNIINKQYAESRDKKQAATKIEKTSEQKQNPLSRVTSFAKGLAEDLIDEIPASIRNLLD